MIPAEIPPRALPDTGTSPLIITDRGENVSVGRGLLGTGSTELNLNLLHDSVLELRGGIYIAQLHLGRRQTAALICALADKAGYCCEIKEKSPSR